MSGIKLRTYKRSDYSVFQDAMRRLPGVTKQQLCDTIGYSSSAWTDWERTGKMPMPAAIACEAIVRRHGQAQERTFLLTITPTGHALQEVKLSDASFFGKPFRVVEVVK